MDVRTKAIVCVLPFAIAGYLGFALAAPAITTWQEKSATLEAKKKEEEELKTKLLARAKLQKEKKEIETSIDSLRGAVPKKPELELLNIDLEKMATESGMEVISFKEPDGETLKKAGIEDKAPEAPSMQKGKEAMANKVKAAMAPVTGPAGAAAKAAGGATASADPDAGLAKVTMQVKVMGDYLGLMELVKKLETYQKVVAISSLEFHVPKKQETKKGVIELPDDVAPKEDDIQGNAKELQITFLLTSYYLP
jgi:Tfp pilus assembly protein PilO